ncbi:DUF4845 domain-containing protein [Marinibactrum halimedae]|uniref:DUF4845 domain-containing protein n=1 Tax=Marinibactrum halimedae TaxID=1444977 RepID=UPI0024E04A60|nr:DUF4845 domain-containing protein [Marinibactrum halimedae]MCD9459183.1 DUF4845 domain-containing protein [Marinibactrum halimedae]
MNLPYKQRGMSLYGWVLVLMVAGFFFTVAFKLGPVYIDNSFIASGLKDLGRHPEGVETLSNGQIKKELMQFFSINNVRNEEAKNIKVQRNGEVVLVNIDYEIRVPMFANIDVVLTFNNQLNSKFPGQCCTPINE